VLARQVVDYLRALLLIQMGNAAQVDLSAEVRAQAEKHARAFSAPDILRMVKAFNAAAADQRGGWQPSLPLELALAEVIETEVSAPSAPTASSPQEKKTSVTVSLPAPAETKPAKPAQEEPRAADSGITIGQVAKAWKQICATVKSDSMNLNALLNSSHPMDVKNGVLVIGFTSEILRGKADTPEQIEIIRKAVVQILGGELSVKCVVSNAKNSNRADVKADGMVAAALKHGGEIVDVQE
jgi:DNA polymerase-3 subunit gamma/tau